MNNPIESFQISIIYLLDGLVVFASREEKQAFYSHKKSFEGEEFSKCLFAKKSIIYLHSKSFVGGYIYFPFLHDYRDYCWGKKYSKKPFLLIS